MQNAGSTTGVGLRIMAEPESPGNPRGATIFTRKLSPAESKTISLIVRDDVTQLIDGGTIETGGFSELVFSFGGERLALRLPHSSMNGRFQRATENLNVASAFSNGSRAAS